MLRVSAFVCSSAVALTVSACSAGDVASLSSPADFAGCAAYDTRSDAQRAWENAGRPARNDADKDGQVCESKSGGRSGTSQTKSNGDRKGCRIENRVVQIGISRSRSPQTVRHFEDAIRSGYPAVLTIDRAGADENRQQSLAGIATRDGYQRDEYPPAISAEGGIAERGPMKGKRADVRLIPATDNARSGASMGVKLRQYCSGQKFRLIGF